MNIIKYLKYCGPAHGIMVLITGTPHWMAVHAHLKNVFMENEKYHNLMTCIRKYYQRKFCKIPALTYKTIDGNIKQEEESIRVVLQAL